MLPHLFPLPPRGEAANTIVVDDRAGPLEEVPFELTAAQREILHKMNAIVVEERERRLSKEGIARVMKKFDDDEAILGSPFGLVPDKRVAPCGRNDACPCGSGRKYKRCCIKVKDPIKKQGVHHGD